MLDHVHLIAHDIEYQGAEEHQIPQGVKPCSHVALPMHAARQKSIEDVGDAACDNEPEQHHGLLGNDEYAK